MPQSKLRLVARSKGKKSRNYSGRKDRSSEIFVSHELTLFCNNSHTDLKGKLPYWPSPSGEAFSRRQGVGKALLSWLAVKFFHGDCLLPPIDKIPTEV
jgi:hypothetical protein